MRYLRMLSNSLAAALLASAYVVIVFLQLNPSLPLAPARLAPIAQHVGSLYALHLTAFFYALLVVRQLLAREPFSPAWLSIRELLWMCAVAALGGAALMYANLQTFVLEIESPTAAALESGALILAGAAGLFALLSVARARSAGRNRAPWATLMVIVAAVSVGGAIASRGRGVALALDARPIDVSIDAGLAGRPARVTVIALDAGSLDFITSATAEGRLPNFGRILDAGAVMRIATVHPTSAETVWAAVATGKLPQKNGIRSASAYFARGASDAIHLLPDYCFAHGLVRLGLLAPELHSS
ncbi:MAG TPA: hypothetical protein VGJ29_17650, partial [Vicinamibacterales bacterium]